MSPQLRYLFDVAQDSAALDRRLRLLNRMTLYSLGLRAPEDEQPEPPPTCACCGRSVGTHGDFCNHCIEAAEELPDSDDD